MTISSLFIQRIILPIIYTACIFCRPVALGIPYLLFLFYLPFVPCATSRTIQKHTGYFFKVVIGITSIIVLLQIAFQIVLFIDKTNFLPACEYLETLFRHIGLVKVKNLRSLYWIIPDVLMIVTNISAFILLKKLTVTNTRNDDEEAEAHPVIEQQDQTEEEEGLSPENYTILKQAGIFCAVITLLLAATLRPSVPSGIYYLIFLIIATVWSLNKEIGRGFAIICRCLLVLLALHLVAVLTYQTPWPQEIFGVNDTLTRWSGLSPLLNSSCNSTEDVQEVYVNEFLDIDAFLSPIAIIICYYTLAITSGFILNEKLMRRSMKRLKTFKQIKRGESISADPNAIPLDEMGEEELQPTIAEHIAFAIGHITDVICKHSYIISNIMMMVWSIVYHSWLTFVFLLVANLLWIIPNQRKNMHRLSPFIVIYAEFLLLAQYVYCMNLTEDELPSSTNDREMGFVRYTTYPCIPLLLKTLFTFTFWLTLRQMKYEATLNRQASTLAHLAAPFQVTVSAATSDLGPQKKSKKSKIMLKAGAAFKSILLQLWIWIVVFALFICAIYGSKMTVFRITYMALFLTFVVTFQLSWRIWKRIMFAFWVTVIGFSMLTLIMVYTYQFNNFPNYWEKIGISKKLQEDIGLQPYPTKILFVHLFYPTLMVIITVVQLQMFHNKYLQRLDLPSLVNYENSDSGAQPTSSVNYGSLDPETSSDNQIKTETHNISYFKLSDLKKVSFKQSLKWMFKFYDKTKWLFEVFWLLMELHLIKVILVLAFLVGIEQVSAAHIAIIIFTLFAVTSRTNTQTIYSGIISLIVGTLLILKMIYQIDYISQSNYDVHCNGTDNNITMPLNETSDESSTLRINGTINGPDTNSANWLGFNKLLQDQTLMQLFNSYISYIVIVTIYNVILMAQQRKRFLKGKSTSRPKVIFPRITRNDADKDLNHMIKYLFNFAFFKFGVEATLVMIVVVISSRMDIIALFYSVWLCILFSASRTAKSKIWPIFQWFIVALTLLQYVVMVNLPPFLCFVFPWNEGTLQQWAWLPDASLRTQSSMLLMDFLLLMCTCRQMLVFRIEKQYEEAEFVGGSNKSVIEDINNLGSSESQIQTHDFVTFTRNWLDIIKCIIFLGHFWMTLAIVFLAGTNRVNIFSVGYLIGSFVFLWQGAEFYLRPIYTILRWWIYLIAYNVLVIVTKAFLQIPACVEQMDKPCLLVKLFGILCIGRINNEDSINKESQCTVPIEDVGLTWDCLCFTFLILQLRIFQSYYFCHIINETKASTILASRGAELIEGLRRKQVKIQATREEEILQKIKKKMDRIKANQQKLQPALSAPTTHFHGGIDDRTEKPTIVTHQSAVRSGDYYLFEDLDEKVELDLIHERPSAGIEDALSDKKLADKLTIEQVLSSKFQQTPPKRKHTSETSYEEENLARAVSLPAQPTTPTAKLDAKSTISEPITPIGKTTIGSDTTSSADSKDDYARADDPQPSTSRGIDENGDDADDEPDDLSEPISSTGNEAEQDSSASAFITAFISGVLVSMTLRLYKLSRNYRYVTRVLSKEKKALKQEKDFGRGHRIGAGRVWAPLPSVLRTQGGTRSNELLGSPSSSKEITQTTATDENGSPRTAEDGATIANLLKPQILAYSEQRNFSDEVLKDISEDEEDFYSQKHSILTEFLQSLWFALISNTDLLCYLCVFINMVASASILALPMPLMVFLWGSLTVPRPSKTFWVTLIAYTEVVVLIKCVSQFELWFWKNSEILPSTSPMAPARIIGIEKKPNYATYDLLLLLVVFFHRVVQKQVGIWQTSYSDELLDKPNVNQSHDSLKKPAISAEQNKFVNEPLLVNSPEDEPPNSFPAMAVISSTKYCSPFSIFVKRLLRLTNRVSADVYVYIFLCDFINFFVLLFGFTAFGSTQGDGGVTSYLEENKIPITFLIMLLLQFVFIIVDRALYLRKNLIGKIIFQIVTVIAMHIWLFFLVPIFSEKAFNAKLPPVIYYIFKCFYFLLSAYQIRCGYPRRISGNCLTKGFTMLNLGAFKVYMLTPFLFELRTLMDWIWTDSSMPLFEWLKMEDIFASIYELKCSRQMEKDFPTPRGQSKGSFSKYLMGGGFLIAIIALVWGPLALFALGNTVGEPNVPNEVRASLRIGPYEPVYIMSAQSSQIHQFNERNFSNFNKVYLGEKDKVAQTFLSNYENDDVAAVELGPNSTSLWSISPPDFQRLKSDLINNVTLKIRYKYSISRTTYSEKMSGIVEAEQSFDVTSESPVRNELIKMLNDQSDGVRIQLPFLFPKFLKVKNLGGLKSVPQLFRSEQITNEKAYRNLTLTLHQKADEKWWEVLEECNDRDPLYNNTLRKLPYANCQSSSVLYTFSDKLFPATLSWLTAGGVIGIYSTFVFLASRFFRSLFSGSSTNIMYTELPYVDRILQLCLDIYLVRESLEFSLEEDLFAKLIFLYRSPETMIRWTRPAEEQSEDEEEGSDEETIAEKTLRLRPIQK